MNYAQQMKHPLWQKKRLEVLEANEYTCQNCDDKETTLHVHHPFYKRGAMIWDYAKEELECLCEKCHKDAHALDERLKKTMSTADSTMKWRTLGAMESYGLYCNRYEIEEERIIMVENHEHGEGVCDVFSIRPLVLFENLSAKGEISLARLLQLRRDERIRFGMNVFPPPSKEEHNAMV